MLDNIICIGYAVLVTDGPLLGIHDYVVVVTRLYVKFHGFIYQVAMANVEKLPPSPKRAAVVNVSACSEQSTKMKEEIKI
jgi:hypothetical protein